MDDSELENSATKLTTVKKFADMLNPEMRSFTCESCGLQFKAKGNLKRHLRLHLPNQIHCSVCNRYFDCESDKEKHIEEKHRSNVLCDVCGKSFRSSSMKIHRRLHTKAGSADTFTCPFESCKKRFVKRSIYEDHLNTHTGSKPYICTCTASFSSRYSLTDHVRHCVKGKYYECDLCSKVFPHRSSLHRHRQQHSDTVFTCTCGSRFPHRSGLRRHQIRQNHVPVSRDDTTKHNH